MAWLDVGAAITDGIRAHHDPAPMSGWHHSPLGVAVCDDCGRGWPCHLLAWGSPQRVSGCNVCGGDVHWNEGRAV